MQVSEYHVTHDFEPLLDNKEPPFASHCDVDLTLRTRDKPGHTHWQSMYIINAVQPEEPDSCSMITDNCVIASHEMFQEMKGRQRK
ncbi:hypothetical protein RRG08_029546 [Elysia crispata]|uniref:Uncharacterized protein n=1 Tax=Elysia crispata TaxID=231223 RepID=A0AAE1CN07_9GAST|nr:hypothetical protein RRG08_029546 [Elysia crispata]